MHEHNSHTHMILSILPFNTIDYILKFVDEDSLQTWSLMQNCRRKKRHDDECYARVMWCLKQGPDFHPAHEHKHRAPGDNLVFFFGIPPWNPDGSVNPSGVPPNYGLPEPLGEKFQLLDDCNAGWECHNCQKWISHAPREYEGKEEPRDWWWCTDCKKTCIKKLSLSQKKIVDTAAQCVKINTIFNMPMGTNRE